ncbi:hypothetical protein WN943_009887 [Citrus x changshan-huyou]
MQQVLAAAKQEVALLTACRRTGRTITGEEGKKKYSNEMQTHNVKPTENRNALCLPNTVDIIFFFQTRMQTQGDGMRLAGLGHRSNQEAKKNPGCSWVQKVNERMKTFTPGAV